jgi:hypothetical protein
MINLLRRLYRDPEPKKGKLLYLTGFGLCIFLFLFLFKPFGIYQIKPVRQFFISLGFGCITTFVLLDHT